METFYFIILHGLKLRKTKLYRALQYSMQYNHHVLLRHNGSMNNTVEYRHKHTQLNPLKTHKKYLKNKKEQ